MYSSFSKTLITGLYRCGLLNQLSLFNSDELLIRSSHLNGVFAEKESKIGYRKDDNNEGYFSS